MKKLKEKSYETVFSFLAMGLYWIFNFGYIEMMDSVFNVQLGTVARIALLLISGVFMIKIRNYAAMDYYERHFRTEEKED